MMVLCAPPCEAAVFSPLSPADVVTAMGRATRDAARSDEPASEFSAGQLMSAYSVSRHLGVELAQFGPVLRAFADEVAADLRRGDSLPYGSKLAASADELAQASDAQRVGDIVAAALDELRGDEAPAAQELRVQLRAALRRLSDQEVEMLAEVIEGPRS
jgi:hypothetical protein